MELLPKVRYSRRRVPNWECLPYLLLPVISPTLLSSISSAITPFQTRSHHWDSHAMDVIMGYLIGVSACPVLAMMVPYQASVYLVMSLVWETSRIWMVVTHCSDMKADKIKI